MTTEHVSVPREVYENLAQISEGNMSKHDMQDLASEAYNILSRATPSDGGEVVVTKNEQGQIVAVTRQDEDGQILSVIAESTPSAPRVVTDEDAKELVRFFDEETPWQLEYWRRWKMAIESFATSLPAAVPGGEVRLWDTQWMSIVNHDNCYRDWSKDDAIAHAVKMTEQAIARNVADGNLPPKKTAAAPQAGERG